MKKFEVTGIEYDFDENENLDEYPCAPKNLVVECEDEERVIDTVSDITGWLVKSVESINEI